MFCLLPVLIPYDSILVCLVTCGAQIKPPKSSNSSIFHDFHGHISSLPNMKHLGNEGLLQIYTFLNTYSESVQYLEPSPQLCAAPFLRGEWGNGHRKTYRKGGPEAGMIPTRKWCFPIDETSRNCLTFRSGGCRCVQYEPKKRQIICFEWSPPWHFKTACWHHFCLKLLSRDFCPTNYPNHLFHLAGHCACQSVKQDINMSVGHVK